MIILNIYNNGVKEDTLFVENDDIYLSLLLYKDDIWYDLNTGNEISESFIPYNIEINVSTVKPDELSLTDNISTRAVGGTVTTSYSQVITSSSLANTTPSTHNSIFSGRDVLSTDTEYPVRYNNGFPWVSPIKKYPTRHQYDLPDEKGKSIYLSSTYIPTMISPNAFTVIDITGGGFTTNPERYQKTLLKDSTGRDIYIKDPKYCFHGIKLWEIKGSRLPITEAFSFAAADEEKLISRVYSTGYAMYERTTYYYEAEFIEAIESLTLKNGGSVSGSARTTDVGIYDSIDEITYVATTYVNVPADATNFNLTVMSSGVKNYDVDRYDDASVKVTLYTSYKLTTYHFKVTYKLIGFDVSGAPNEDSIMTPVDIQQFMLVAQAGGGGGGSGRTSSNSYGAGGGGGGAGYIGMLTPYIFKMDQSSRLAFEIGYSGCGANFYANTVSMPGGAWKIYYNDKFVSSNKTKTLLLRGGYRGDNGGGTSSTGSSRYIYEDINGTFFQSDYIATGTTWGGDQGSVGEYYDNININFSSHEPYGGFMLPEKSVKIKAQGTTGNYITEYNYINGSPNWNKLHEPGSGGASLFDGGGSAGGSNGYDGSGGAGGRYYNSGGSGGNGFAMILI